MVVPSQNPQECFLTLTAYDKMTQKQKSVKFLLKQQDTYKLVNLLPVTIIPNCGLTLEVGGDTTTVCKNALHYKTSTGINKTLRTSKSRILSKQPLTTRLKELREWKRPEPLRELSLTLGNHSQDD
jgi:hypothetical protein